MNYRSDRTFKLWDYNVSHRQMMLRSSKNPDFPDNLDIVFWQVEFVSIPTKLCGIDVRIPTEDDLCAMPQFLRNVNDAFLLAVVSGGNIYYVVCGGCKVLRNRLDICESTLIDFAIDHPAEWYGEILAKF